MVELADWVSQSKMVCCFVFGGINLLLLQCNDAAGVDSGSSWIKTQTASHRESTSMCGNKILQVSFLWIKNDSRNLRESVNVSVALICEYMPGTQQSSCVLIPRSREAAVGKQQQAASLSFHRSRSAVDLKVARPLNVPLGFCFP